MQDAAIDTTDTDAYGDGTGGDGEARGATAQNSTGRYEYAVAASAVPVGGGALTLSQGLLNTYTTAAATGDSGSADLPGDPGAAVRDGDARFGAHGRLLGRQLGRCPGVGRAGRRWRSAPPL